MTQSVFQILLHHFKLTDMTQQVKISFYDELKDFFSFDETLMQQDKVAVQHVLEQKRSVKDLFESMGVPHTEVDVIMVNGRSVGFDSPVNAGDDIALYPTNSKYINQNLGKKSLIHCVPEVQGEYRFILDVHLGRLASYLRMLGFDVLYTNQCDDEELAETSAKEARLLLTCDRLLLMRKIVEYGYFVRSRKIDEQLLEVVKHYRLQQQLRPFTRCMSCNGITHPVDKNAIEHLLEPGTGKYYDEFYQCEKCQKVYWRGNHFDRMQSIIDEMRSLPD